MHTKWLPLSYIHCFVPSKQVWGTFYLMGPWSITPSSSALLLVCSSGKLIKPKSMCLQPRALSLPNLRCHRSFYGLDGCTLRSHMLDSYSPPSQYRKCDNCGVGVGVGLLVHEGRDSAAKLVSLETGSTVLPGPMHRKRPLQGVTCEQEAEPPSSVCWDFKRVLSASRAMKNRLLSFITRTA